MKELLRVPPERDLPPGRHELRKEKLMQQLEKEDAQQRRGRRRRRLAIVLVPAALLVMGATGYVLLQPDEVVAAGIGCYDDATLEANVTIVSTTGDSPERLCAGLWSQGVVRAGTTDVPELTACVNRPGAVLVFPSDGDICARLGLHELPAGYETAARRFAEMRDAVVAEIHEAATAGGATDQEACLDRETALDVVQSVLERHGFQDWRAVLATGDYGGRSCANHLAFDDQSKRVLVIPSDVGIDPSPFGPH